MTPFALFGNTPFSEKTRKTLGTIESSSEYDKVRITLANVKKSEDFYIAPTLAQLGMETTWADSPKTMEVLLWYYVGILRPLKAITLELYASGGFTPAARAVWGKNNKIDLRERVSRRLDSVVPIPNDAERSVVTLAFESANPDVFSQIADKAKSLLTEKEQKLIISAAEGEVWSSIFGSIHTDIGSALAYLMQESSKPDGVLNTLELENRSG